MRVLIGGGPRTGKTTLASKLAASLGVAPTSTDAFIGEGWSGASEKVASLLNRSGPWVIEGVAAVRGVRKWMDQHPGRTPPVDKFLWLREPREELTPGQETMAKGCETVLVEILPAVWNVLEQA